MECWDGMLGWNARMECPDGIHSVIKHDWCKYPEKKNTTMIYRKSVNMAIM